ncbi:MAG: nucleotide sugar dehydrogenase [Dehalococcoidales bacterium]|jgi:UDPglucose 6-dehydrogenase/UDP-N-acetyl-D-galactosamine dehydrogenase
MKQDISGTVVCVVGVGYVGMPLARALARSLKVIGFDIDTEKVKRLKAETKGQSKAALNLTFTADPKAINKADFVIICVPTPVTPSKEPDLTPVIKAAETVGKNMKRGSTVILESTVFPGVTEEIVKPLLEKGSGLKCGRDFKIAYSPERINPGDEVHTVEKTVKVVAGMDRATTERIAALYRQATPEVYIAKDIRTAEAAKVIENIQRDLNIALMNELSLIFEKMGLNTRDVLDAAGTKWNFHRYSPGLVGGHCIPVDPYYLVYKALEHDYHAQVITAGRAINDAMPRHVADMTIKALNAVGKVIKGSRVLIMGLTYKENVRDTRESPVKSMIKEFKEFGVEVEAYDPLLNNIEKEFGVKAVKSPGKVPKYDAAIITVAHQEFLAIKLSELKAAMTADPVLVDIRHIFEPEKAAGAGFYYKTL